jgi:rhamnogalacturonan endolyase
MNSPTFDRWRKILGVKFALMMFSLCLLSPWARANVPGGGTGTGANVTLVDNGNGTWTMGNGIVSILINKTSANINAINYTYNNSGSNTTTQMLSGGYSGGQMYWSWTPAAGQQGPDGTGTIVVNPSVNGGNYAEVSIYTTWSGNSSTGWADVDVHYSMVRGSTGFYATGIHIRPNTYPASTMSEWRSVIYVGGTFDWFVVNPQKNLQIASPSSSSISVSGAPAEVTLWTGGIYKGRYEDKYMYSDDIGNLNTWGWTSVSNTTAGTTGLNVGLWMVLASHEFYNGGPMKRELINQEGPTELNMLNGTHYGMGVDYTFAADEPWTKVYGPYFVYCNSVSTSVTDPYQASEAMYTDAQAQAVAEPECVAVFLVQQRQLHPGLRPRQHHRQYCH